MRLGREPSFFMNLFVVAFQWFATSHTWKSVFFPRERRGISKTHRFICRFGHLKISLQTFPYRSNLYLQNYGLPIGLRCAFPLAFCASARSGLPRKSQDIDDGTNRVFEWRCEDSRPNQGYQSLLYLSRFIFYLSKLINVKTIENYL